MKTAIVLFAGSASLSEQAGEIKGFLSETRIGSTVSLWLFYHGKKPCAVPDILPSGCLVKLISVEAFDHPESFLALLEVVQKTDPAELLIFASDGLGRELATRLSFRLKGSSALQVSQCRFLPPALYIVKPAYGNHLKAEVRLHRGPFCLSVARHKRGPAGWISVDSPALVLPQPGTPWVETVLKTEKSPDQGWADADVILAVGQGVGSGENMAILESVAKTLNAGVGASRPVVMNAWADMNRLIGMSGSRVSPKLCIAVGVSGNAAFSIGIQDSEFVVAINTDRTAPIFRIADVGIVDDLMAVLAALERLVESRKLS